MGIQINQPWNHKNTRIEGAFGNDNVIKLGDGRNIIKLTGLNSTVWLGNGEENLIWFIDPETGSGGINRGTVGNGGNSVLIGATNSRNILIASGEGDRLYGGNQADVLMAMGPGAQAFGRNGNDTLVVGRGYGNGGLGNDTLQGYNGSTLHGGGGKDTFTPMIIGTNTQVTIDDFNPLLGDRVNLAFLGFHASGVQVAQSGNNTVFSYVDPDAGAATLTLQGTGAAFADFTAAVNQGWVINAPTQL